MGNALKFPEPPSITWDGEAYYIESIINPVKPPKIPGGGSSSSSSGSSGSSTSSSSGSSGAASGSGSGTASTDSNANLAGSLVRFAGGTVFTLANENFSKHLTLKIYEKVSGVELVNWLLVRRNLWSRLSGAPYIVPIFKAYQDEDRLYLLQPFFSGGDLAHYIDNGFAFTYKTARSAIATVVIALQHLHVQGIVHEDVRPENIFIDAGGACHLALTKTSLWLFNRAFPIPRMVLDYTSPEVLRGEQPTPASDWWSFGATFAHMVQGHPPFDAPNEKLLKRQIFSAEPTLDYSIPKALRHLLHGLLNKDPVARISSAAKVINHPFFAKVDWDAVRSHSYESMLQPSGEGTELTPARNEDGELSLPEPPSKLDPTKQAIFAPWDWHPKKKKNSTAETWSDTLKTIEDDRALLGDPHLLAKTGCPLESTRDGVGRVIFSLAELPIGKSFQTLQGNKLTRTDEHTCLLYVPHKRETRFEIYIDASSPLALLTSSSKPLSSSPSSSSLPISSSSSSSSGASSSSSSSSASLEPSSSSPPSASPPSSPRHASSAATATTTASSSVGISSSGENLLSSSPQQESAFPPSPSLADPDSVS